MTHPDEPGTEPSLFNIAVLGQPKAGKSSLVSVLVDGVFSRNIDPTINFQIKHLQKDLGGTPHLIAFWDFPANVPWEVQRPYLARCDGIIYVIDATNIPDPNEMAMEFKTISSILPKEDLHVAIAVNKMDQVENKHLPLSELLSTVRSVTSFYAKEVVRVFEVSALTQIGVKTCLNWLLSSRVSISPSSSRLSAKDVPWVLIKLKDDGPEVVYYDFMNFPSTVLHDEVEVYLNNIALSLSIALAQGEVYSEGLFELPAGYAKNYRMVVASVRLNDSSVTDTRMEGKGYAFFCFFVKLEDFQGIKKLVFVENKVIEELKKIEDLAKFSRDDFFAYKEKILGLILEEDKVQE